MEGDEVESEPGRVVWITMDESPFNEVSWECFELIVIKTEPTVSEEQSNKWIIWCG